jgi:hypothetical protein
MIHTIARVGSRRSGSRTGDFQGWLRGSGQRLVRHRKLYPLSLLLILVGVYEASQRRLGIGEPTTILIVNSLIAFDPAQLMSGDLPTGLVMPRQSRRHVLPYNMPLPVISLDHIAADSRTGTVRP